MTTPALNITDSAIFSALRSFILSVIPSGIEVVKAQDNRVAEPEGQDFVVMTPLFRERIEWNTTTYADGYPSNPSNRIDLSPTKVTIQCDFHGPNSADNIQIFTGLFFSGYAYDYFASGAYDIKPLFCTDPRQVPFIDGEQQYENMWTSDVNLQANISTTVTQSFADELEIAVINVDVAYPPV